MDTLAIRTATAQLVQARRDLAPRPAPVLKDPAEAYAVQANVAHALGWGPHTGPQHWKSGGPSRESVLTHARLPPPGVWVSPADARHWPFNLRLIEAEVALRLGETVDAQRAAALDPFNAHVVVDAMCVSIEIVDSRWVEGLDAPPMAKLADLQSHGALVLGDWVAFDGARDWAAQTCRVNIGAQPVHNFRGTHAMSDPAFGLAAWLRHATSDGAVLPAGSVVTTGTWCGMLHAQAGDLVEAVFEGIGTARVQL